jgi:hypothetical protein
MPDAISQRDSRFDVNRDGRRIEIKVDQHDKFSAAGAQERFSARCSNVP